MRRILMRKVRQAGQTGINLKTLYVSTRIASEDVKRLLKDAPEITAIRKPSRHKANHTAYDEVLYKHVGKEESRIQDSRKPADPLPEPVSGQAATVGMPRSNGGSDELGREPINRDCEIPAKDRSRPASGRA